MRDQITCNKPIQMVFVKTAAALCLSAILLFLWTNAFSFSDSNSCELIEDWRDQFAAEDIPLGEFLEWTAKQKKTYGHDLENWPADLIASYRAQLGNHLKERQGVIDKTVFNQRLKSFALDETVSIVRVIHFLFEDWMRAPYTIQAQYTWLVVAHSLCEPEEIMVFPNDDEILESAAIASAKEFLRKSLKLAPQALNEYIFRTSFVDNEEYGHRVWLIQTGLPNENAFFLVIDGKTGEVIKNTVFPDAW